MESKRRVYTISGKPEEVIAVAFAKCSRDPRPFDVIVEEIDADKAGKFHQKYVLDYGHGSVAEHAVAHIALENVSILATKAIEDARLASYTEKSTRYQVFEAGKCHRDENIMKSQHAQLYEDTVKMLFDTYSAAHAKVSELMKQRHPRKDDEKDRQYADRINSRTCDVVRYILPAGTYTQLGTTINARSLEHTISKLLSHPLQEMRAIGAEIKAVALNELPTLVKYADASPFLQEKAKLIEENAKLLEKIKRADEAKNHAKLVRYTKDGLRRVVTAILFEGSDLPYETVSDYVDSMRWEKRAKIIDELMNRRGAHDAAPREFEEALYTFDVLLDYGAYRDIQRHRICSQTTQMFSVSHGFEMPAEIEEVGMKEEYAKAMSKATDAYNVISRDFKSEAQYIVPLAYRLRLMMTMNLREVFHFTELRSGKNGHKSYRRIAQEMADEVIAVNPEFGKHLRIDRS